MVLGCVISHADTHVWMEVARRDGAGALQRITDSRSEIIVAAIDGHQSLLQ